MTQTQTKTPPPDSPIAQIKNGLDQMRGQLQATLPSHIPVDRFQRVVLTAININPDLLSADRRSLFNAAVRAAQDGLLPDGREGALVIFKDKSGKKLVQWMPMVFGLIKKIRQSGEIDGIGARIVYENEIKLGRFKFIIEEGQEKLTHEPIQYGPRGEKMFVYAYARFSKNGHVEYEPLHRDDVMKRKAKSRGGNIWTEWEEEMWRKTAIRSLAKRLPLSADIMRTVDRDEQPPSEFDKLKDAAVQDASTAMQQLGAPEPETEIPEGGGEIDHAEVVVPDSQEQFATQHLHKAIDGLDRATDLKDLAEYVQHVHDMMDKHNIPQEVRARLLAEFDAACEFRAREMEEMETEKKLL